MPAKSRANIEQEYFAEKFGFFFRINTGWITPVDNPDLDKDIFGHPYLEMLWALQGAIQNDTSTLGGNDWTLDNFCYKPISGEGCIVESAMQYFHDNYTILTELYPSDQDVKTLSTCLTPLPGETRACFDSIGSPVLTFAIFGDTSCQGGEGNECSQCEVLAGGMQFTFLLQHNEYSLETAEQWEAEVFIRNVKTFNWAMQNDYHTDMTGPVEGMSYNIDLAI